MGLLVDAIEERNLADEVQRRGIVLACFPMKEGLWQGMPYDELVRFEEMLHQKLASLDFLERRNPDVLDLLKKEYTSKTLVLKEEVDGLAMSAYDVLLNIAKGQTNFSVAPLSSTHRDVSGE